MIESQGNHSKNVHGGRLEPCCFEPGTGYYRDGFCRTGRFDSGRHTVCAKVTEEFLRFTASRGNDLSTPHPELGFPGLEPGDRWCLCAFRWKEAWEAGVAPPVFLDSCHEEALKVVPIEALEDHVV
mgnify:CR=1 FL=1